MNMDSVKGKTVELVKMEGENLPSGLKGEILFVDSLNQIHVAWENGSGLALIPNVDEYKILD